MDANELMIGGIKVKFPCKPYPSQLSMMSKIIKGLQNGHHCLLESPTGSGKTLALLCSALAWQQAMREKIEAESLCCDDTNLDDCPNINTGSAEDFESNPKLKGKVKEIEIAESSTVNPNKKVPRIWFGTRTHKQIAQITHELSRTAYKHVNMTILSSREHTCVHPINEHAKNKNDGCRDLRKGKHPDALGAHCSFYQNVHRIKTHSNLYSCGLTSAWDLEELVKLGRRVRACPYYSSRELTTTASIVFCPYNYLIDPGIRSQMSINLNNQILILDEAHNIEDCSRDAASNTLNEMELINTIADLDHLIADQVKVEQHKALHLLCTKIGQWLQTRSSLLAETSYETWSQVWSGQEFLSCLAEWGITADTLPTLQKCFTDAVSVDEENEEEFPNLLHTASQALLGGMFRVLSYLLNAENKFTGDYKIAIIRQAEYGVPPPKRTRDGWIMLNKRSTKYFSVNLHFWCLNPAVAFSNLNSTHSIILTSGTLSPMQSFSSELGLSFPIQLEASHVISDSQVWVGAIGSGPNGQQLQATYQNTNAFNFQDELGKLILSVCRVVPYGVLCFFSSYKILQKLCERWENTGLWNELMEVKVIFSEPHGKNRSNFEEVMQSFYEVTSSDEGNATSGALLFAVCRGKISEGLDFSDNNARAVITVGIPFPNFKDQQVELKRKYNDEHSKSRGLLSGSDWYEIQAFRALNQALGRCIRHKNDWGALVIVDDRFCKNPKRYCKGLSKWVRLKTKTYSTFQSANDSLASFCHARQFGLSPEKAKENHSTFTDPPSLTHGNDSMFDQTLSNEISKSLISLNDSSLSSFSDHQNTIHSERETDLRKKIKKFYGKEIAKTSSREATHAARALSVDVNHDDVIMIPSTPEKKDRVIVIPESPEVFDYRSDDIQPTSSKRKGSSVTSPKATISSRLAKKCKQAIQFDSPKHNVTESFANVIQPSEESQELFAPKTRRRRSLKANRKDEQPAESKSRSSEPRDSKAQQTFSCVSCNLNLFIGNDSNLELASDKFHFIQNEFVKDSVLYVLPSSVDISSISKVVAKSDNGAALDTVWCATDQHAYQLYACKNCQSTVAFRIVNSDKYSNFFVLSSKTALNKCST